MPFLWLMQPICSGGSAMMGAEGKTMRKEGGNMIFSGCQSKSKELSIIDKTCPQCGAEIELFSVDTEAVCERCGYKVYNDTLSCVQWCRYARQCVGDEMYERMMKVAEHMKERQAQEA